MVSSEQKYDGVKSQVRVCLHDCDEVSLSCRVTCWTSSCSVSPVCKMSREQLLLLISTVNLSLQDDQDESPTAFLCVFDCTVLSGQNKTCQGVTFNSVNSITFGHFKLLFWHFVVEMIHLKLTEIILCVSWLIAVSKKISWNINSNTFSLGNWKVVTGCKIKTGEYLEI